MMIFGVIKQYGHWFFPPPKSEKVSMEALEGQEIAGLFNDKSRFRG
jgi:hypothetical protein